MNAITIKHLDNATFERLSEQAASHRRSVEQEAAELIAQALKSRTTREAALSVADRIAAMTPTGVIQTDSTRLVREDRDR